MQVLPPTLPTANGRDKPELGGQGLAGSSNSDANPDKHHAYTAVQAIEVGEDVQAKDVLTSRLIDRSPISSETQAALLALLSEPDPTPGTRSQAFSELVNRADPASLAEADSSAQLEESAESETDDGPGAADELDGDGELEAYGDLDDRDDFGEDTDFS